MIAPLVAAAGVTGMFGAGTAYSEYLGAKKQNQWNLERQRDHQRWQEKMSSTAHQREVADLRAAGLNPILSATKGASSPQGAMITSADPSKGVGAAATSAIGAMRLRADLNLIKEQTALTKTKNLDAGYQAVQNHAKAFSAYNKYQAEKSAPRGFGWADAIGDRVRNVMPGVGIMMRGGGFKKGKGLRKSGRQPIKHSDYWEK